MQGYLQNNFQLEWDTNYIKEIVFGDFANTQGKYQKIDDLDSLPKKLQDFMLKHNS